MKIGKFSIALYLLSGVLVAVGWIDLPSIEPYSKSIFSLATFLAAFARWEMGGGQGELPALPTAPPAVPAKPPQAPPATDTPPKP